MNKEELNNMIIKRAYSEIEDTTTFDKEIAYSFIPAISAITHIPSEEEKFEKFLIFLEKFSNFINKLTPEQYNHTTKIFNDKQFINSIIEIFDSLSLQQKKECLQHIDAFNFLNDNTAIPTPSGAIDLSTHIVRSLQSDDEKLEFLDALSLSSEYTIFYTPLLSSDEKKLEYLRKCYEKSDNDDQYDNLTVSVIESMSSIESKKQAMSLYTETYGEFDGYSLLAIYDSIYGEEQKIEEPVSTQDRDLDSLSEEKLQQINSDLDDRISDLKTQLIEEIKRKSALVATLEEQLNASKQITSDEQSQD